MMDPFLEDYIIGALWSSMDNSDPQGGDPMDDNYGSEDIEPATLAKMKRDCEDFQEQCSEQLNSYEYETGYTGGVDFWLTRNRHGAGFWDRGLGEIGDILTAVAHSFGSFDLYVGDDGKIYGS